MAPFVSVLVPAFNAADTLPKALLSVRRQTFTDLECVVVDDGSDDATAAVVHTVARQDARFRCVGRPHAGIVAALSTGLGACRGEVIVRLDADDWMARERVAEQVAALAADPGLVAVGTHVRLFPRDPLTPGRLAYEAFLNSIRTPEQVRDNVFVECPIAHPSLAVRAAALRAFGYRERGWPEDYDLVLRWVAAGHRLGVVPRALVRWRDPPGRLSRTHPSCSLDSLRRCKAAFLAAGPLSGTDRYVLWGYGDTGKTLRRALAAHGKQPSAIIELHPRRLGQRMDGVIVVPPSRVPDWSGVPVVVSVAGAPAREEIRRALVALGRVESHDFWCAA
jgi:glycosyltransferase involved in cell wall biosynthesis